MRQQKSLSQAFSLIELSIVILIIGILVAGVTQSSRLVKQFRITNAKKLTETTSIYLIKDMILWLETIADKSLLAVERENNATISQWNDINPGSSNRISFVQNTEINKPQYIENYKNALPGIDFNKAQGDWLAGQIDNLTINNFTFFIVYSSLNNNIGGSLFHILDQGNINNSLFLQSGGGDVFQVAGAYASNYYITTSIPRIITNTLDRNGLNTCYENGVFKFSMSWAVPSPNYTNVSFLIGKRSDNVYFNGTISELILYARVLTLDERKEVENYLSKKWAIKVS